CDNVDMHGVSKAPHEPQKSYSYAQKLQASTTYGFCKGGRGKVPWDRAKVSRNPSISDVVSSYMLGLRKRKVAKGEIPTSVRAISPGTLRRFYDHNHAPKNWNAGPETPGNWCGGNVRKLLQAVYLITFTCLLRIDEVLKIQLHDIEFGIDDVDGTHFVSITLPFHKSSPFGDIPPFILCALPKHMAHLCPVRALADWIAASKITRGYLFPNIDKCDRPITVKNTAMKPEVFLQLFRNNLCDLGEPPYAYGTHSFRHGGCQWLSVDLRWSIRQICEWGGWSTDFMHLTIVKYLISWNDAATLRRDEFFKLDREATTRCWSCGRTCACA
ncbi:DNA breaking-rejoining enzyme, partial [Armillaria fumosa]